MIILSLILFNIIRFVEISQEFAINDYIRIDINDCVDYPVKNIFI